MEWQPIKTAPRNGRDFLAAKEWSTGRFFVVVCRIDESGRILVSWDHDDEFNPTHWMPLPEAPKP